MKTHLTDNGNPTAASSTVAAILLMALTLSRASVASAENGWCNVVHSRNVERGPTLEGPISGTNKVLFYRLRFPGETSDILSEGEADWVMRMASATFERISYDQFQLQWTITPQLALPRTRDEYGSSGYELLASDARAAALVAGFNWQDFHFDIFQHRRLPGTFYAAIANLGGRGIWLVHEGLALDYPHLVVHEMGHNLGLPHANLHYTGNPLFSHPGAATYGIYGSPPFPSNIGLFTNITRFDPSSVVGQQDVRTAAINLEYGDPFDIMGNDQLSRGFCAPYRRRLNWLTDSNVIATAQDGVFRIYPVDAGRLVAGRAQALKLDRVLNGHSFDGSRRYYWIQHHGSLTTNLNLSDGIQLRWVPADDLLTSQYIDTTPATASPLDPTTRLLRLGRTFTDPLAQLHVTPVTAGGQGDDRWFDVEVRFGPYPLNLPPTVTLSATATNLSPDEDVTFTAAASDPDDETLHFFWDFGDGTFTNGTATVTRRFSGTATGVVVRCEVSDGRGGVASQQVLVGLGHLPSRIAGRVRDTAGCPLAGAQVHNGRVDMFSGTQSEFLTTRTDSAGNFTLLVAPDRAVAPGAFAYGYRVLTPSPGFALTLLPGATTNVDFTLEALPRVRVGFQPGAVVEGTTNLVLRLSRTGPTNVALEVAVRFGGTTDWTDFDGLPAMDRLVIPAGASDLDVSLRVNRDIAVEGTETLTAAAFPPRSTLRPIVENSQTNWITFYHPGWELRPLRGEPAWFVTEPPWAVSSESTATLTVLDATPPDLPRLSVVEGSAQPREHPPSPGYFEIIREGNTNEALEVIITFGEGQAVNGVDFELVPELILMPAGVTNVVLTILPIDDGLPEGPELVALLLPQPPDYRYGVARPRARFFIQDSDLAEHRLAFGETWWGTTVLKLYGEVGRPFIIETSTNLVQWDLWASNVIVFQPTTVDIPPFLWDAARFYRSQMLPLDPDAQ